MSIDDRYLRDLLHEISENDQIDGYEYESRFDALGYENDPDSSVYIMGLNWTEVRPEYRKRDKHSLYGKEAGLINMETEKYDGRDEYFGHKIKVTPDGYEFINRNPASGNGVLYYLDYLMKSLGWPLIVGILLLALAIILGTS